MAENEVKEAFTFQGDVCTKMGSAFTGGLCALLAENLDDQTGVGAFCLGWDGDPAPSADSIPLRLCGGLHALVLSGRDKELAEYYPPNKTTPPSWEVVKAALENNERFLLDWMQSPPQTNEVSRSAVVWPSLMALTSSVKMPLRLLEVGASGGLNLHCDKFGYSFGSVEAGLASSILHLTPDWHGEAVNQAHVEITSRAGCDLNPLNPNDEFDSLRLRSYVWPDQADRQKRLNAALEIAQMHLVAVERMDAVEWLNRELEKAVPGVCTVVYSTIAWQYLPPDAQAAGEAVLSAAAKRATDDAPLAWLRFETDGKTPGAGIRLQVWPLGIDASLGRADFHARWVDWRGL